jgi:RNAse (barnase) inhibitor barstar
MDYQTALDFIKAYYEQTWNNLVWLLGIAFGVIGVLMPLFIQWIQSMNNKKQMQELDNSLKKLFDSRVDELNKRFSVMQIDLFFIQGCMYVTQGNLLMKTENGEYTVTKILHSFLYAAYCFLMSEREENLRAVIKTLIDIVTSKNFPQEIKSNFEGFDTREIYDITISLFDKKNSDGKYSRIIQILREKIKFIN